MGCFGKRHSKSGVDNAAISSSAAPPRPQPSTPATRQLQDIARKSNIDNISRNRAMKSSDTTNKPPAGGGASSSTHSMLQDTEDFVKTTTVAPAVTHEIIKPTVHEIVETEVHRDIHTHEVHRTIQPVYDVEILPPKHFVPAGPNGELVEVSEDQLPACTGRNQRWHVVESSPAAGSTCSPARGSGTSAGNTTTTTTSPVVSGIDTERGVRGPAVSDPSITMRGRADRSSFGR